MELIERHRVTHLPGAPTIFSAILNHPRRGEHDLSSLRVAIVSAASIPEQLVVRMRDELELETVMTGYGLTENHALGAFTRPDDGPTVVATSVGRMAPDVEVRIVDDDGADVPAGSTGEIVLGGYAHMTGYFGDPEATAAAYLGDWLRTGDIGSLDEAGYLRITDRKKDMYIVGGFNVASTEVEQSLLSLPGVDQVAVVGMPDEHYGEVGAAFVVPRPGMPLSVEDVLTYARVHMANYKVPRHVEIVDALPVNATGKVLKEDLRRRLS
jgi:acyl-CoA synthetase (AMP-forming)/AMP-acid ligase II